MKESNIITPWGPIGEFVFKRTYARRLNESDVNSPTETFEQTIDRVVNACNSQLKMNLKEKEQEKVREILLSLRGMVAGRFLWQLGTKTVERLGLLSLQNCAACVIDDPVEPFVWAFEALMLGSGVGYNAQLKNVYSLPPVKKVSIYHQNTKDANFIVPDSREGWVILLRKVLESHFKTGEDFTYSTILVRGAGEVIKGFGGTSSGPGILINGITKIHNLLNSRAGNKITPTDAVDIMNIIGTIVVAGNVRRSAQIAIGDTIDKNYLMMKRWDLGNIPSHRALSNNSVVCKKISDLPDYFWEGYLGNGEPYGLINLETSRKFGRTGDINYPDPDVVAYNPCVTGETEVLTKDGFKKIEDLVGKEIEIWNGREWSLVKPFLTATKREVFKVDFSDGRSVTMTGNHNIITSDGRRIPLQEVEIGTKLIKFLFPILEGSEELDLPYERGLYAADGSENRNEIWLYGEKRKLAQYLRGKLGFSQEHRAIFHLDARNLKKDFVPSDQVRISDKLLYLAGLIDGVGHLTKDGNIQITSVNKEFLIKIQKMISTLGANAKLRQYKKSGVRSIKGKEYFCQDGFRLLIPTSDTLHLRDLGLDLNNHDMGILSGKTGLRAQHNKIERINSIGFADVFCFSDMKNSSGVFGGVMLGNCAEQSLANYETCCLAEVYLPNNKTKEELFETVSWLYKIAKHSLRLPCHLKQTEKIVHKNMRMGIGVTGYLQASEEQRSWLKETYEKLRKLDVEYSEKMGWPTSIKLTTVKPSGTLSLLAGVTPGAHPAYAQYYIRRVRISTDDPLVKAAREAGYHVEFVRNFDGSLQKETSVISFPCKTPEGTTLAREMSAVDQLETIKRLQAEWSDNSVSVTVYYRKEELPEIKKWLEENYENSIKTVSFLLHSDHGFDQAPIEEISEERYIEMMKSIRPISFSEVGHEVDTSFECEGGACPVI